MEKWKTFNTLRTLRILCYCWMWKDNKILEITKHTPPEHKPGVFPRWIATLGVTDVIAGGIGQRAIDLFNEQGINVFAGAPVKSEDEIVKEFIAGELSQVLIIATMTATIAIASAREVQANLISTNLFNSLVK